MPDAKPLGAGDLPARLGSEYQSRYSPAEIALHVRLALETAPGHPLRVHLQPLADGRFEVTFVGRDFFAEFALLVGLLAAHRLEIEGGHVNTSEAAPAPALGQPRRPRRVTPASTPPRPPASRTIVDVFRVRPGGEPRDPLALERTLEADANELLALVAKGLAEQAHERLGCRLAERFSKGEPPQGALAPLEIRFDNPDHGAWTLMEVRGQDTPGFLYALATALALRDIYVHEVEIASAGDRVRDRFLIARRDGARITSERELRRLQAAVALIKQFAHLLPLAPDPARALRSFGQLVDRLLDERRESSPWLGSPEGLSEIARLLGASTFLWEDFLRLQAEHLLPVLGDWHERPLRSRASLSSELDALLAPSASHQERRRLLNEFKDREMLLVDMRHLLDPEVGLVAFSEALSDLAEAVVEAALAACVEEAAAAHGLPVDDRGRPCPVAVLGLGKFGGRELGYASDIELLFVYDGSGGTPASGVEAGIFYEQVVRELTAMIAARQEGIFHVDLRLRPHGAKGPLASPLAAVRDYYRTGGGAAPFERQALLKLRRVAGDPVLGKEVERVRDAFVWSEQPWDRENALHLRERQARELVPPGRFNVKYSAGALVEVEYAVQYLQLEHGRARPSLRTPSTLPGLERLVSEGLVQPKAGDRLRAGYLFWRAVADALRMVRGNAPDLLLPLPESEEMRFLARRLGYQDRDWARAARRLLADVDRHRDAVAGFFSRRFRS